MNTRKTRRAIVVVLSLATALAASACSSAPNPPPRLTQGEPGGCALGLSGALAATQDTLDGIAISFTSKTKPEEMRERANDAAAQHGPGAGMGRGHEGKHGDGGEHGLKVMQLPASRSVAEDIEGGARVRLAAVDPADTEVLRAKVRERVSVMNGGGCK